MIFTFIILIYNSVHNVCDITEKNSNINTCKIIGKFLYVIDLSCY